MTETFPPEPSDHAIVVVMGDIGRSPRMCYHALSLANHGFGVDLVGYVDSKPHEKIATNSHIRLVSVRPPPESFSHVFRPLALVLKFVWLLLAAFYALFFCTNSHSSLILMQNPPGIPTMMLCYLAAKFKGASFNIDWHNYTFSILNTCGELGKSCEDRNRGSLRNWMLIRYIHLAAWWEGYWGRKAHWNLCVSQAMRRDLASRWNVKALTLYDKAPAWIFRPMNVEERHYFLIRLLSTPDFKAAVKRLENYAGTFSNGADEIFDPSESSIFSRRDPLTGQVELLASRPLLLVSSTSWTPDEDFNILYEALKDYERHAQSAVNTNAKEELPNLLVVITGKGPLREEYLAKFSKFHAAKVQVVLAWLAAEDYPKILASADLGVSLHTSTSGLDLPMKVVDMFGCHLPVLAKRFEAIGELVGDGTTGALFDSHQDLKRAMVDLVAGFPNHSENLRKLKQYFVSHLQAQSWEDQWDATFWPLIRDNLNAPTHEQKRWERFAASTSPQDNNDEDEEETVNVDGKNSLTAGNGDGDLDDSAETLLGTYL